MSEADLRAFYEREAAARDGRSTDPRRTAARERFVALLRGEGRTSVVEPGCGPGHDGVAFVADGFAWTGIDLAQAHVDLCRAKGLDAVRGSLRSLPFPRDRFDAAWTMSTLLHVPDADLDLVLTELTRVVVAGGPVAIGLWTQGEDADEAYLDDEDVAPGTPARRFVYRSEATVRRRFGEYGEIEDWQTWSGRPSFTYQWFVLRLR